MRVKIFRIIIVIYRVMISWLVSTPLKNMKVSWDHYSQYIYMEKIEFMFQSTNQLVM